jgi:hypothetical protein
MLTLSVVMNHWTALLVFILNNQHLSDVLFSRIFSLQAFNYPNPLFKASGMAIPVSGIRTRDSTGIGAFPPRSNHVFFLKELYGTHPLHSCAFGVASHWPRVLHLDCEEFAIWFASSDLEVSFNIIACTPRLMDDVVCRRVLGFEEGCRLVHQDWFAAHPGRARIVCLSYCITVMPVLLQDLAKAGITVLWMDR